MNFKDSPTNKNLFLAAFGSVVLSLMVMIGVIALKSYTTFWSVWIYFVGSFYYRPHANIFYSAPIFGIHTYSYLYVILAAGVLIVKFLSDMFLEFFGKVSISRIILNVSVALFICVMALQITAHFSYFQREWRLFDGKTIEQKNAIISGEVYSFANFCKKHIEQDASVELVTDLDLSRDPGMLNHRQLAYYLYPIDLRGIRKKENKYQILFNKKKFIRKFCLAFYSSLSILLSISILS